MNPLDIFKKLHTMMGSGQLGAAEDAGWQMGQTGDFENPDAMHPAGGRWPIGGTTGENPVEAGRMGNPYNPQGPSFQQAALSALMKQKYPGAGV